MKKLSSILVLLTIVSLGVLSGCTSEDAIINSIDEQTQTLNVQELYNLVSVKGSMLNSKGFDVLGKNHTRSASESEEDIVGYLLTLSEEEIDSLYLALGGEAVEAQRESMLDAKLDSLMQIAPAEEVAKLYAFMDDYATLGGHSVDMVEIAVSKVQSPVIKRLTINSAALYDCITSIETARILAKTTRASRDCVLQLAMDCGGVALSFASMGMDYASGDYGFVIIDCVHDIFEIVSAIRRYHRCEHLSAWR